MNNLQTDFEMNVDDFIEQHVNNAPQNNLESLDLSTIKNIELENIRVKNPIDKALIQFTSHGLDDLNAAKLMNRVDSKFILPISFLPEVLSQLTSHYSVLEINNNRISRYQNKYFDTPDMTLYNNHHNGRLNRYKVRRRRYVDTDTEFLEVKLKNNKKRTIKNRIKLANLIPEQLS